MVDVEIQTLANVNNPNSIHGIYPYRGKISAIDAEMIIKQFPKNSKLLDPFCGTGTIVYEGLKYGLNSYGTDINPLAVTIANGKINVPFDLEIMLLQTNSLIKEAKELEIIEEMPEEAKKHFHLQTSEEIMRVAYFIKEMNDYVKSCFYGAICLAARGCNGYQWTSTTVGKDKPEKDYINFYEKFLQKIKKHHYPLDYKKAKISKTDARKLTTVFEPETFDFVFTSPPYFDCLDYTSYYTKIVYNILGLDRLEIKENLIQNFKTYQVDMQQVLTELYKVCKVGAKVIFVVGDKKIHNKVINGGEFFNAISPFKKMQIIERTYEKTSSKVFDAINKTNRKEQIIIWEK
jgi:DNA modification methylase